jgi:nickel-type superoxide dismutase maturation protease
MLKLIKITGNSLSPGYNPGDYAITTTLSFVLRALKTGDIVVFKHPVYGTMVKQIQSTDQQTGELFVVGTHSQSTDSRHFGPIPPNWLIGKVLWHIPNPNRPKS